MNVDITCKVECRADIKICINGGIFKREERDCVKSNFVNCSDVGFNIEFTNENIDVECISIHNAHVFMHRPEFGGMDGYISDIGYRLLPSKSVSVSETAIFESMPKDEVNARKTMQDRVCKYVADGISGFVNCLYIDMLDEMNPKIKTNSHCYETGEDDCRVYVALDNIRIISMDWATMT